MATLAPVNGDDACPLGFVARALRRGVALNAPGVLVRWPGGQRSFSAAEAVRIGRARDCEVVLDSDVVSRHHGVLRHGPRGWEYADSGSTRGSWVDGRRVETLPIDEPTHLQLGEGTGAVVVEVVPSDAQGTVLHRTGSERSTGPGSGRTVGPAGAQAPADQPSRPRPGGALRAEGQAPETVLAHQRLTVEAEGQAHHFYPGTVVRLGREDADVVLAEPSVSRQHATLTHESGTWVLRDQGSAHGTHVHGRRVTELPLVGRTQVVLGAADAGASVTLTPAGTGTGAGAPRTPWSAPAARSARQDRTRGRRPLLVAAALSAVALVVAAGAAFVVLRDPGADRETLARAAVHISLDEGSGSGTLVDTERGLVLTNAHVVAPRATGAPVDNRKPRSELPEPPGSLIVSVAPGLDRPAEPRFRAEVVVADGYLDLAVIRLTQTLAGSLVTPEDLQGLAQVELGESEEVGSGTAVTVVGFPSLSPSAAGTFTQGVISGTLPDPRLGTNRAWFTIDADISPGNSGGLAADDDGRLVGVPTLVRSEVEGTGRLAQIRAVDLAKPLIQAAQAGQPYLPAHLTPLPDDARVSDVRLLEPVDEGFRDDCSTSPVSPQRSARELAVGFDYENFPTAPHQDLLVRLLAVPSADPRLGSGLGRLPGTGPGPDQPAMPEGPMPGAGAMTESEPEVVAEVHSADHYAFRTGSDGCVTAGLALQEGLGRGQYRLEVYGGPDYEELAGTDFAVR